MHKETLSQKLEVLLGVDSSCREEVWGTPGTWALHGAVSRLAAATCGSVRHAAKGHAALTSNEGNGEDL